MRLLRFYIHNFRVLSELDLRFDPSAPAKDTGRTHYHLDFLVGVNGTGKSTVLRLLGRIFSGVQVSFDELLDLPFILEYYRETTGQKIRIANIHPNDDGGMKPLDRYFLCTAPSLEEPYEVEAPNEAYLKDVVEAAFLPERIIAYTTGNQEEWLYQNDLDPLVGSSSELFQEMKTEERTLHELPGWTIAQAEKSEGEEKRFRFVWQDEMAMVTLTGLLLHHTQPNASPLQKVLDESKIQRLTGFSLQFDLSYASHEERNAIWQRLGKHANRAIRSGGKVLLVFQPERFKTVLSESGGALPFFEQMADWYRQQPRLLTRVNLFLERTPKDQMGNEIHPPLHTWDWLSDGERSFVGRMCLFMLFGEVESLILLDEPEVHFNDFWKRHIVSMMDEVFEGKATGRENPSQCHVLIATHSSISLSDVQKDDVLILERSGLLTGEMKMTSFQTFGADPSDIMVHVFGTGHAMGEYSVKEVESWLKQAAQMPEPRRRGFLNDKLGQVSPGYWAYRIRREIMGVSLQ